ncbi:uncharacterized protein B0H18DRAFT_1022202 [Fomitopsis serialis]|uniref:uncharacterized protein n=1 Tax=Fomitopsis serialis TaxID=139415 RepID=UPI0020072072|nr:uncharacterized protein B0H18DRAFT_1022202 [Neoantrodia serialis]KAH9921151.1 hypothetical protein B0H18DRAFT_1022202 [Neoantrodia serialis]
MIFAAIERCPGSHGTDLCAVGEAICSCQRMRRLGAMHCTSSVRLPQFRPVLALGCFFLVTAK